MRLARLRLKNIRSYESADVELAPGTTLIAGDVGTGKTSLLYAIEMALFGFAEVDAAYLIRHDAEHAQVSVTLEDGGHTYEIGRQFRRVTRRAKESFEVERLSYSEDGARTAYSATELRQRVIELFRFPDDPNPRAHSDLWRWAVYVPQERMREVLSQGPEERLETIRRALGVERYRTAAENSQEVATALRQMARLRGEEVQRLAHWETELVDRHRALDELERRRVGAAELVDREAARLSAAAGARAEAESRLALAQGDRRELVGLEREEARDQEALDRARAERRRLEEPPIPETPLGPSEADRLRELESERPRWEAERADAETRRTSLETRLRRYGEAGAAVDALRARCADANAGLDRADRELRRAAARREELLRDGPNREPPMPTPRSIEAIDIELGTAREALRAAHEESARAEQELGEWEELVRAGVCPRCRQAVRPEEFDAHRREATERAARARESLVAGTERVGRLEEERRSRERYERLRERWMEAARRRETAEEELRRAEERRGAATAAAASAAADLTAAQARQSELASVVEEERTLTADRRAWEERRRAWETAIEGIRRREAERQTRLAAERQRDEARRRWDGEIAMLEARRTERGARLAPLRARAGEVARFEHELAGVRAAEEEARSAHQRAEIAVTEIDRDLLHVRERRADAERGVAERSQLLVEIDGIERRAAWLAGPFRESLLGMERRILTTAQASFANDLDRFFRILLDDPMMEARTDPTFMPSVLIRGAWTPADALSGGERTSLALAFRLALGRLVRTMGQLRLDTLILDEPTDGFSPEQIVRMGDLLATLDLPQVLLVSHEFELSSVADRVLETRKVDGRSVVVGRGVGEGSPAIGEPPDPPRRRPKRTRALPAD